MLMQYHVAKVNLGSFLPTSINLFPTPNYSDQIGLKSTESGSGPTFTKVQPTELYKSILKPSLESKRNLTYFLSPYSSISTSVDRPSSSFRTLYPESGTSWKNTLYVVSSGSTILTVRQYQQVQQNWGMLCVSILRTVISSFQNPAVRFREVLH